MIYYTSVSSCRVNEWVDRAVQSIATAVADLQGGAENTTMKLKQGASQIVRADKIADQLEEFVKDLSWHISNLMVRCGSRTN